MQGFPGGNNYLPGQANGSNPEKDPKQPGTLQSVILFEKMKTPGINVARGDGFPTKIIFNGEECSLPTDLPISPATMINLATTSMQSLPLVVLFVFILM